MSQLVFRFPFKKIYYEQDFYVSSNNFSVYKLIESWPNWPGKWLNIYGAPGSGKTHLAKILEKKIGNVKIINAGELKNDDILNFNNYKCLILDSYEDNIKENLFYSTLNHLKQIDNFLVINSRSSLIKKKFKSKDLQSRISSFVYLGIELPTDELLKVIISKTFSEKQINLNPNITDYIIKNVDRSYERIFKFLRDIDDFSLSTGKSININLIKKLLNK